MCVAGRAVGPPRRRCLPAASGPGADVSLWNILRNNIGKDLSKVSMPVQLNEPLNTLQRLCEELEYSSLLDQASRIDDPRERMVLAPARPPPRGLPPPRKPWRGVSSLPKLQPRAPVLACSGGTSASRVPTTPVAFSLPPLPQVYIAAFAVSAYSSTYHRAGCKPFNPVLGETYECERPDRGFRFISEQVRPGRKGLASRAASGEAPSSSGARAWERAGAGGSVPGPGPHAGGSEGSTRRSSPLCGRWDLTQGVTVPCCRAGMVEAHRRLFSFPWEGTRG